MMLSINKIICPTDFSEPAGVALTNAAEFASHFEAELCVVISFRKYPSCNWRLRASESSIPFYYSL